MAGTRAARTSRATPRSSKKPRAAARAPETIAQPVVSYATLTAWAPGQPLHITLERAGAEPQVAESTVALSGAELRTLVDARARVVVSFVDGDRSRPVVTGVLQRLPTTLDVDHAQVEARRVTVTGRDEVELKCGESSITLRRNGRLVVKGTAVETAASGVNRIKGGTVRIN